MNLNDQSVSGEVLFVIKETIFFLWFGLTDFDNP